MDAVELRLDLFPGLAVEQWIAARGKPVVASARRLSDGGRFQGTEPERARLLARSSGAAWIDVELDAASVPLPRGPRRIVSYHDLAGIPADLDGIFERCLEAGADLVKIAVSPPDAVSAFRLLDLPTPALGMGEAAFFTRVLAPLTYCAATPVAPGMPSPETLLDLYGVRRLRPETALFGVAGDPIAHSKSPQIHNAGFRRDGIDAVYLPFRVRELGPFVTEFFAHGGRGLSVTAPLKVQAARLARRPDDDVAECGAANTLLADGRAINTDLYAFLELLPKEPADALVLGAGGAARAAVVALRRLGHRPRVWARDPSRAAALKTPLAARPGPAPIVVNTTPLEPPAAPFVLDLRYGPGISAPQGGVGGETFLLAQARHQYRLFCGKEL